MGLTCSHNAWHGPYDLFTLLRRTLAEVAGLPPLELMEGFYDPSERPPALSRLRLPIRWECLQPHPLHDLLRHSDCDGEIAPERCQPIADALEQLMPLLPEHDRDITAQFIAGLRNAAQAGEPLRFG